MASRPWRPPRSLEAALAEIEAGAGIRYDPQVAAVALGLFRQQGYTLIDT